VSNWTTEEGIPGVCPDSEAFIRRSKFRSVMSDVFDLVRREREALHEAISWRGVIHRSRFIEYAQIEHKLIKRFIKAKSAAQSPTSVEIDGFVSKLGGRRFLLRPTLAADFGILCAGDDLRKLPEDYEFIHMQGLRNKTRGNSHEALPDALYVVDYHTERLPTEYLAPEISLKDAGEILMAGYIDPPEQLTRSISISLASSPGEMNRIGGMTTTLMPMDEKFRSSQTTLFGDLKRSIPPDLTSENRLPIVIEGAGRFFVSPFPWRMHDSSSSTWEQGDAGLFSRAISGRTLQESTLGFAADSSAPKTLDEVWMKQADFSLMVDRTIERHVDSVGFDLDVAKFLITVHMNHPITISTQIENFISVIIRRLIKLRKEYDYLGYAGLVNLDATIGSPRSVLSIAKGIARSEGMDVVNEVHVNHALSEFVNSHEEVFDAWAELGKDYHSSQTSPRVKLLRIGKTAERLHAYLVAHPNSSRAELREAVPRVQDRIFNNAIEQMLSQSLIYHSAQEDERFSVVYASL
jgi:hypothetical protein